MKKFLQGAGLAGMSYALPVLVFAQGRPVTGIESGFERLFDLINRYIIPLAFALAIVYFLYGVLKYVTSGGDEEKRKESRNMMIYGIIAIFVMTAVWGLVNVLRTTLNLNNRPPTDLPQAPR